MLAGCLVFGDGYLLAGQRFPEILSPYPLPFFVRVGRKKDSEILGPQIYPRLSPLWLS